MLVLREESLNEPYGTFKAATSLNLIDESSNICETLKDSITTMSELEKHHFVPKSYSEYSKIFHRELKTCMYSTNGELQ